MTDVYIGLDEAAAFEGVKYKTLAQRVKRNPREYKVKAQAREGGGKDQIMVAVDSLTAKGRRA